MEEEEASPAADRRSGSGMSSRGSVASSPCTNVSEDDDNEINVVDDDDGAEASAENMQMAGTTAAPLTSSMSICEQLESMVTRYETTG